MFVYPFILSHKDNNIINTYINNNNNNNNNIIIIIIIIKIKPEKDI